MRLHSFPTRGDPAERGMQATVVCTGACPGSTARLPAGLAGRVRPAALALVHLRAAGIAAGHTPSPAAAGAAHKELRQCLGPSRCVRHRRLAMAFRHPPGHIPLSEAYVI